MRELGIRWEIDSHVIIDDRYYFEPGLVIHPVGGVTGGLGQLGQWREIALGMGVELRYESRVRNLLGNDRRIEGVSFPIRTKNTKSRRVRSFYARAVFKPMREMRARYLGSNADLMKVRGSKHDTGEVLMMALAMGAKAAGHWQGAHAHADRSRRTPDVEIGSKANRYGYPYGITVNTLGQRFSTKAKRATRTPMRKQAGQCCGQPGALAYQIYDQKTIPLLGTRYEFSTPIEANTIDELASKIGIESAVLNHTIKEFNNAARKDVPFDATKLDGKCTEGITPKKSNWSELPSTSRRTGRYAITGGVTFTFGGLQINTQAQVLNTSNNPIRGLFASGDIIGLFFHNYPSCTGQTRNVVFSRLAGRNAAALGL